MILVWLKFVHVGAIAVWVAGLICLPGLYVQRAHVHELEATHRLQRFVRFAYVGMISPAAFLAVASGIALIFLRETFVAWFTLKLVFVGVLVVIHIVTGLVIVRLFDKGEIYPVWRFVAVTILTVLVSVAILFLVLGKPAIDFGVVPDGFMRPGALREIVEGIIPWAIP